MLAPKLHSHHERCAGSAVLPNREKQIPRFARDVNLLVQALLYFPRRKQGPRLPETTRDDKYDENAQTARLKPCPDTTPQRSQEASLLSALCVSVVKLLTASRLPLRSASRDASATRAAWGRRLRLR